MRAAAQSSQRRGNPPVVMMVRRFPIYDLSRTPPSTVRRSPSTTKSPSSHLILSPPGPLCCSPKSNPIHSLGPKRKKKDAVAAWRLSLRCCSHKDHLVVLLGLFAVPPPPKHPDPGGNPPVASDPGTAHSLRILCHPTDSGYPRGGGGRGSEIRRRRLVRVSCVCRPSTASTLPLPRPSHRHCTLTTH